MLTCGGGKAGSNGGSGGGGAGGDGGTFSASGLSNFDSSSRNCENLDIYKDNGILAINWYYGKPGGKGGFRNLASKYNGSDGGCFASTDTILYPKEFGISPISLATDSWLKLGCSGGGDSTIELIDGWKAGGAGGGASAISYQVTIDSCDGFGAGGYSLDYYEKEDKNSDNIMGWGKAGGFILH